MFVCGFGEINRKMRCPAHAYSQVTFTVSMSCWNWNSKTKWIREWKGNNRKEEQPLGCIFIGTIFFIALSDLDNSLSKKKKVCVVIVLFSLSLAFFFKRWVSNATTRASAQRGHVCLKRNTSFKEEYKRKWTRNRVVISKGWNAD